MESATRRAQLTAEVAELQDRQLESFAEATFAGWTPERTTAHSERSDRMEGLQRELDLEMASARPLSELNPAA